jgi:hypothetical protein
MIRILLLLSLTVLMGCSKQAVYNTMKHEKCYEKTGMYECDEIEDYDQYKAKRDDLLKNDNEGYQAKRERLLKEKTEEQK